ncbi:DUF2513 domain-containing protein [Ureibacillus composti]
MRRDMELVRNLLIEIADEVQQFNLNPGHLNADEIAKENDKLIKYHLEIMEQAGLITYEMMNFMGGTVSFSNVKLTWHGQDYLSSIENENVWNKTKEVAKTKGFEIAKMSFDLLFDLALKQGKQLIGLE